MAERHLSDEDLWASLEALGEEAGEHLAACAACRTLRREAEEGLALAAEGGAVPEPSPLYWEAFRRQVERRIAEEPAPSGWSAWRRWVSLRSLVPLGAAVALALALVPGLRGPGAPEPASSPLPAWQALPSAADDPGLDVLRGVALSGDDLDAAAGCGEVTECLSVLSDEESQEVAEVLRARLPGVQS